MKRYLIDNKCGVLKKEYSSFDLVEKYLKKSETEHQKISFYMIADFKFFDSFKLILPALKNLFDQDLLGNFSILISSNKIMNPKEFLFYLKSDAIVLNEEDFYTIQLLHKAGVLKFKFNYWESISTLMYIVSYNGKKHIYVGGASFSPTNDQYKSIDLLVPICQPQPFLNYYLLFFKKIWETAETRINNKHIISYLETFSHSEVIKLSPRNFIASLLKTINKDYLVKNISFDFSQISEFQNMGYYSCIEKMQKYGSVIFSNSVGYSELYITSMIIKLYYEKNLRSLLITSAENEKKWENSLHQAGLKKDFVHFIRRHELQAQGFSIEKYRNIDLIIIDNAEYFSISKEQNNRKKNLDAILSSNPDAHVLMISKNIINDSLNDLLTVFKIFSRGKYAAVIEKSGLKNDQNALEEAIINNSITNQTLENLKNILNAFMVKIEWINLDTYFDPLQQELNKPLITTVKYAYDHEVSVKLYERLIPTLQALHFEYSKLKFSKYYEDLDLINWYKWKLCRKIDSSIIALLDTAREILSKSSYVLDILVNGKQASAETALFTTDQINNIITTFTATDETMQKTIISNLQSDVNTINNFLNSVAGIKYLENRDEKITSLLKILNSESKPTIIFSESDDTILYLKRRLTDYGSFKPKIITGEITTIDGDDKIHQETPDIATICKEFEEGTFNILIANDTIPEEIKLPRAKVIINFDIPNNPSILSKRNRKAAIQPNINKTKIYNFQSDKRVDKEVSLLETLNIPLSDLIAYFGIDFILWCLDEKQISEISNDMLQQLFILTKEYKDFLAKKNTDEIKYKFAPSLSNEDIALRDFIKILNISEETLKLANVYFKKPIFTTLKSESNSYFIIYNTKSGIKTSGELKFSNIKLETDLDRTEFLKITKEIESKFQGTATIIGIIRYTTENEQ